MPLLNLVGGVVLAVAGFLAALLGMWMLAYGEAENDVLWETWPILVGGVLAMPVGVCLVVLGLRRERSDRERRQQPPEHER